MVKCFSKKYMNKGRAFNYLQFESYVKMPTSLPQEQAATTKMASEVRIQVFSIMHSLVWLILAYDWLSPHGAGKALQLLYRTE